MDYAESVKSLKKGLQLHPDSLQHINMITLLYSALDESMEKPYSIAKETVDSILKEQLLDEQNYVNDFTFEEKYDILQMYMTLVSLVEASSSCYDALDSLQDRSATAGTDNSEDGLQQILEESGVDTFKDVWQLKNSRNVRNLLLKGFASAFRNTDTLGLLIHCITDGIALASSLMASSESPSVKSIFVVVAIFLHKLPTAFALVALLVKDGLPKIFVLCHLICFSFAAPLGALATYLVIDRRC